MVKLELPKRYFAFFAIILAASVYLLIIAALFDNRVFADNEIPAPCISTGYPIGAIVLNGETDTLYATGNPSIGSGIGTRGLYVIDLANYESYVAVSYDNSKVPKTVEVNPMTNTVYVGYTASGYGGYVDVLDGSTNTVISSIPVQQSPTDIAVNPKTNMIFVANFWSDSVSVIDGSTNTVVKNIPVGMNPEGIVVNPDTNMAYVANSNAGRGHPYDNRVFVIDGSSLQVVNTIKVENRPVGIGVNPITNRIYVANFTLGISHSIVSIIDGATNKVIDTVEAGIGATEVQVNTNTNTIYVLNYVSKSVTVIDGSTNSVTRNIEIGDATSGESTSVGISGLAGDPQSEVLYVGTINSKSVMIINGEMISDAEPGKLVCSKIGGLSGYSPFSPGREFGVSALGGTLSALSVALISIAIVLAILLLLLACRFERRLRMDASSEQDRELGQSYNTMSYSPSTKRNWKEDAKSDFHPRSWLSRYRRTSVKYVLLMALYFHGLGVAIAFGGTALIEELDPSYETPIVPISLAEALAAGPLEEPIFFGIPFYASGNAYVVLIAGAVWASLHVLNTDLFSFGDLAYGNFLFAFVSLFFSLRTWASGKGWLSIVIHSGWNAIVFGLACGAGEIPCNYFGVGANASFLLASLIFTEILLLITFVLYKGARKREITPVAIMEGGYSGSAGLQAGRQPPSKAWYVVPILFHIIGGLIMYFALRRRDEKMAKKGVLIGILLFIANVVVGAFYSFIL